LFECVDLDYVSGLDRRKSFSRYVFTIGGCVVSWKACLLTTVAMSTTEVEYMAIAEATKEALCLKGLYSELCGVKSCITIYCDSQSAIYLVKDQVLTEITKHIDIRYHFVCDVIEQGLVKVYKISTHDNRVDMMMKHVPVAKFELKLSWCYSLAPSGFRRWQVNMLIEVDFTSMMLHGICLKVEFTDLFDPNS
jgi:hypothetical protein